MPPGVIIPVLAYPDVRQAVDWLCRAFGFAERLRIANHRSQLTLGQGTVVVTTQHDQPEPETRSQQPPAAPPAHSVMVRITNIDSHFEQAIQHGAEIISSPTDYPYGERQYTVRDFAGHHWTFSQTIADVDPQTWGGILNERDES